MNPSLESLSEDLTYTIIYLLNEPNSRNVIIHQLNIPKIFSLFTDITTHKNDKNDKAANYLFNKETSLKLATKAIINFFKSWSGLIYLGWEMKSVKS